MAKPKQLQIKFGERFFEDLLGKQILKEPRIAIVELVANSWDSYATEVDIRLPDVDSDVPFSITDNGSGMTHKEFDERWATLSYDRIESQGIYAEKSPGQEALPERKVFGKHGKGRHASFCFSPEGFYVETAKHGI
ncbi:MAG: ATP-binding protein, partial [Cyanobacteria bacterium SZAS LIN-5]|nr:ATP-binding protein [Cyanobacteria bacterium SZAS LIN-5]